jgi:hypothetical protein
MNHGASLGYQTEKCLSLGSAFSSTSSLAAEIVWDIVNRVSDGLASSLRGLNNKQLPLNMGFCFKNLPAGCPRLGGNIYIWE